MRNGSDTVRKASVRTKLLLRSISSQGRLGKPKSINTANYLLEMKGRCRLSKYRDEQENQTFAGDMRFLKQLCGVHGAIVELCGTLQNVLWP